MNPKTKENIIAVVLLLLGALYLTNLTAGVIEFLPDNIPIYGNMDEGVAGAMLWQGIRILSKNVIGVRV